MKQILERLRIASEGRSPGSQHGKLSILRRDLLDLLRDYYRLDAEARHTRKLLSDPVAVHVALLRGEIAKPQIRDMLHVYGGEAVARWDSLSTKD